jgi:pectate lyase-like protein
MKYNLFIILLLVGAHSARANTPLSVTSYGATGDGSTDDTQAIRSALAAAASQGKSLYFPPGNYLCNQIDGQDHVLSFNLGGLNNIAIYGNGATIKTTKDTASTLLYVFAFSPSSNFMISGINFLNTHGKITGITQAVFVTGTSGNNVTNYYLVNCTFIGFGQGVGGQGIVGWTMKRDSWLHPHGHDDAEQNADPAIDISLSDNTNGSLQNVLIEDCTFNGYTGGQPMTCKRGMDGGPYGFAYGLTIRNCHFCNFSEEAIMVLVPTTNPATTAPVLIEGCDFTGTMVGGWKNDDNTAHISNYACRADCGNVTFQRNIIYNYCWGFLSRGIDNPSFSPANYTIVNNKFYAATDTVTYQVSKAIFIQGNPSHPIPGVVVDGNRTVNVDVDPTQILTTTGSRIGTNPFALVDIP